MKRITRILLSVLILFALCLCLCGCDELDQMRDKQAFWAEEGKYDAIIYNGDTYKMIGLQNTYYDTMYNNVEGKSVFVTDPDVPVLLSGNMGSPFDMSDDENFICGYIDYYDYYNDNDVYYSDYTGDYLTYCKEDIYDEIVEEIKSGIEYTGYGTTLEKYDDKEDVFTYEYYYFTQDEVDAINDVFENVEPTEVFPVGYTWSLDNVSEDKYFGESWAYEVALDSNSRYYIYRYDMSEDTCMGYYVSDKVNDIFKRVYKTYETIYTEEYVETVQMFA